MKPVLQLNSFEVGQLFVAIGYSGMKSLHPDLQDKIRKAYEAAPEPEPPTPEPSPEDIANAEG